MDLINQGYPAARVTAEAVYTHLANHYKDQSAKGTVTGDLPEPRDIEKLIDTAFWASLLREEQSTPKISLGWLRPDMANALRFERPLALTPGAVSRVAPAVERPGLHLGVWKTPEADAYSVWGVRRSLPALSLVVEVVAPGLLVVKHSRQEGYAKFANLAVLEGNRIRLLDHSAPIAPACPSELLSLVRFDTGDSTTESGSLLMEIAASMRHHGRGGTLLIVPSGNATWPESIMQPVSYRVSPPFAKISQLLDASSSERDSAQWRRSLDRTIQTIGGLTGVDGATIITERYDVLGFGAKIGRREGASRVHEVQITEPVLGNKPRLVHPSQIGGTRHMSAAQFVHDQRDSLALVASQDGRFTVFSWSACDDVVQAHFLETMLL